MKLTTAAAAAVLALSLSTLAHAVHLDSGGRGQVLIYPYYTVNNQQQTLLSVTNTSSVAQALKIRFSEGYNGREVMDFNVFLSPFDSWTGTVFALRDAGINNDGAAILSTDSSCTAPLFSDSQTTLNGTPYIAFRNTAFLSPDDGGPYTINRTREGYVEIYAMADLAAPLSTAIAHGSNGSPPTGCAQALSLQGSNPALSTPTGGLMGSASIVSVGQGTLLSVRAEALSGFTASNLFTDPFNLLPNLTSVNDGVGPLAAQATARIVDANGKLQTLSYPGADARSRRVDAVSAVLMADRVFNEFQIASSLSAASDWMLTFPTKLFYVDALYTSSLSTTAIPPFSTLYDGEAGFAPTAFDNTFHDVNGRTGGDCPAVFGGQSCGSVSSFGYVTNAFPAQPSGQQPQSRVLGSQLTYQAVSQPLVVTPPRQTPVSDSGYLVVDLKPANENHQLLPSAEGKVLRGLPVVGFWASNVVNNNVGNGVLSNYAAAVRHATSVTCVKASDGTPCD